MKFIQLAIITNVILVLLFIAITSIYFLPDPNGAQLIRIEKTKTCALAHQLARDDFRKGKYQLVSMGTQSTLSRQILDSLLANYNITVLYAGCIGTDEAFCYSAEMGNLLTTRFGSDFYDRARTRAFELAKSKIKWDLSRSKFSILTCGVPNVRIRNRLH